MEYKVLFSYYDPMSSKPAFKDAAQDLSEGVNAAMARGGSQQVA